MTNVSGYKADIVTLHMTEGGMIKKLTFFDQRTQTEHDLSEIMHISKVGTENAVGYLPNVTITFDAILETVVSTE